MKIKSISLFLNENGISYTVQNENGTIELYSVENVPYTIIHLINNRKPKKSVHFKNEYIFLFD